jgi:hypothetical protein|tara:strand:+ start:668 stop:826 length:159 start_codon:yes stop_codon:yes gene_type:complete
MKKKEPSIEIVDNLLMIGTQKLKKEYGGFNSYYLRKWVNDRLHEQGYNKINY